jgi:KaiC/GvpD/RAD55 family RecA-like ATPase
MLEFALQYAARNWPVFAVSRSKKPFKETHGFKDATTDPAAVEAMWRLHPNASIALATGHGLVVLDVDGPEGLEELREWVSLHGPLPQTLTARTGRGAHIFFAYQGTDIGSHAHGNLHVRGRGGFVVLAPSPHPNGRRYEWIDATATAAPLTNELKELMQHDSRKEKVRSPELQRTILPTHLAGTKSRGLAGSTLAAIRRSESTAYPGELPRIKSALAVIPAVSYEIWYKVGMILQSLQWIISDGTDLGFELWDEWSQSVDEKYPGLDALESKWRSFGRGDGLGIGSLFHLAIEHGWKEVMPDIRSNTITTETSPSAHGNTPGGAHHGPVNNSTLNGNESVTHTLPSQFHAEVNATLPLIRMGDTLMTSAPPRDWVVNPWIPANDVTMLAGDGGTGKSTLAMQLAIALASNGDWLGLRTERQINVLYISAEDSKDELHWRVQEINKHLHIERQRMNCFQIVDLSQRDPTMALYDKHGSLVRTPLFEQIETAAREHSIGCLIIDAAADVFGGNEVDRHEVRAFLGALRAMALRLNAAIVLLAHPSVDAMKTDRGYSGSTHWNNAVRSRMWFKKLKNELGEPTNPDMRVLELAKSNRARGSELIYMLWSEGRFVVSNKNDTTEQSQALQTLEEEAFLECLAEVKRQGRGVHVKGPTAAPATFMGMRKASGFRKDALHRAMQRLLEAGKIVLTTTGPASRQRSHLEVR